MLLILVLLAAVLLAGAWYMCKRKSLTYWQKRGFPSLPGTNVLFGNCTQALLGRQSFIELYRDAHFALKAGGHKVGGMYLMNLPMLLVTDSEIMKQMLQSDFDAFADRGISLDIESNPLSAHMFNLDGEAWQAIRRKLSPTFTSGKMKVMFPIVEKHIDTLIEVTKRISDNGNADVSYSEWLDRAGVDIIGHVALGLDCNTLEQQNETFFEMTSRITRPKPWKAIKMLLWGLSNPANFATLLSSDEEMSDFFIKMVKDTVAHRQRNNIKAKDFLQLLIDLVEDPNKEDGGGGLTMLEIAAEAFVFFVAGFETTSRTVTFALYSLAQHQHIQDRLRAEIRKDLSAHNGEYTYDWIMNNEYLDMVVKETLRLYPPVMTLNRMATRDYPLKEMGLVVPKGTCIVFSSMGFHHDPENFAKPLEFIPDRFSKGNVADIKSFTNIPFGDGPRFCIGKRFGYLQSKLELAKLLMNFQLVRSAKTEYPMKISPLTSNMLLTTKDPVCFRFKPL